MKTQGNPANWQSSVIFGSLAWLVTAGISFLGLIHLGIIEQLLLLAPLVIVPLGLALIEVPSQGRYQLLLYNLIRGVQPLGATAVIIAFLLPNGLLAGVLAAAWLGVTGLVALLGLIRFIAKGCFNAEQVGMTAGLLYLSVGGGWLVLSRLGLNPLGFDDLIVLLTAVHFHYAGFAAPLITGITGRILITAPKTIQKLHQISVFGVIAGTPLVAAGITFSPLLEVTGAIVLATSLTVLAYLIRFIVRQVITHRPVQILLTVSAICLIIGMLFTYVYAISEFTRYGLVSIPQMARFHGLANALGFALCGLLAWNILLSQPQALPLSSSPSEVTPGSE